MRKQTMSAEIKLEYTENETSISEDICENASTPTNRLVPTKSKNRYESAYITFNEWRKAKSMSSLSEDVVLTYFHEMSKTMKPSTLWANYSMLKSLINVNDNINISAYTKVTSFLRRQSDGYQGKKAKVMSTEEIEKFLTEAPDDKYLATKVVLIFGITGACRMDELARMTINNIENYENMLLVKIRDTKIKKLRSFIIDGEFYHMVKKYEALRPKNVHTNRFFLNYQHGKCTSQVIGKNKFGSMAKQIAKYLNLPNSDEYTSHSFRRSSESVLVNAGADMNALKLHNECKSSQMTETCIEDSTNDRLEEEKFITRSIDLAPSTSDKDPELEPPQAKKSNNDRTRISASTSAKGDVYRIEEISQASINLTLPGKNITLQLSNCSNINITLGS